MLTNLRKRVAAAPLAIVLAGCSASTSTPPAASHQAQARPVLSAGTGIWFAPLPFGPHPGGPAEYGSTDYMDLFKPNAPWAHAAKRVHVFKLYATAVRVTSDEDLKSIISGLNRARISIALEMGPLTSSACGQGVEGFDGADSPAVLRRIKEAGGTVRFIAMDEPYFYGSLFTGPNACTWPATLVAHEIRDWKSSVKLVFPDVIVGDIEPLAAPATSASYANWMATFRTVSGTEMSFFDIDIDWSRPAWPQEARELETSARARGIEFGIIYFGNADDASDLAWTQRAAERMAAYEVRAAGRPDSAVFQSWENYPRHVLPETDPTTFTGLIEQYLGTRTALTVERRTVATDGGQTIDGKLTDSSAKPVAGAPIDLAVTPRAGPGEFKEYTSAGTVPDNASRAVVGFRTNTEGADPGPVDFFLYQASYKQSGETKQRIPDDNFSQGLAPWGASPSTRLRIQPNDRGSGWMLHVTTGLTPPLVINSGSFPVTPGATYIVSFGARVSQASRGYFTLIFLGNTEVSRVTLRFTPTTFHFSATTDTNGSVEWHVSPAMLPAQIDAQFVGDSGRWPAIAGLPDS